MIFTKKDMTMHTSPVRLTQYIGSFIALLFVVVLFPHPAHALTIQPIFYDSGNYSHYFAASTLTADTNKSAYCPGDTVTVSGTRPFSATCGNGAATGVNMSINGTQLSSSNAPSCPYVDVTMCTAYTSQTQEVCKTQCHGTGDTQTCTDVCTNHTVRVCNSGATQTSSVCNENDITTIVTANPSWYVLRVDENPLNYQYSFQIGGNAAAGVHQIPIELSVTDTTPPNDGVWLPVDTSLSYTVNTPDACQNECSIAVNNIPWGAGNKLQPGNTVQVGDFNTLNTAITTLWDTLNNAGVLSGTFANSGFSSTANSGNPINHSQIDNLHSALAVVYGACNLDSPSFTPVYASSPIKASDFNSIRTAVEGFQAKPSSADNITAFSANAVDATISGNSISLTVPYGTDVTALTPTITLSYGATVSPTSGTAKNFTNPVSYVVTAQDGATSKTYTVTVTIAAQPTGGGGTPPGGGGKGPPGGGGDQNL